MKLPSTDNIKVTNALRIQILGRPACQADKTDLAASSDVFEADRDSVSATCVAAAEAMSLVDMSGPPSLNVLVNDPCQAVTSTRQTTTNEPENPGSKQKKAKKMEPKKGGVEEIEKMKGKIKRAEGEKARAKRAGEKAQAKRTEGEKAQAERERKMKKRKEKSARKKEARAERSESRAATNKDTT